MKRIWHPYWKWEDYHAGLYVQIPADDILKLASKAASDMSNAGEWGLWMSRAVEAWPAAAMHNLACESNGNGRAWVGSAAMCHWRGMAACVTRNAWWRLTDEQRNSANAQADSVIASFRKGLSAQVELFS